MPTFSTGLPIRIFDPVAFQLGPVAVHWYGIAYLAGFICVYLWMARPAGRAPAWPDGEQIQDFLFYALIGVLVGGRTFFVINDIVTKHDAALYFGDMPRTTQLHRRLERRDGLPRRSDRRDRGDRALRAQPSGLNFTVLGDEVVVMLPVGIALTRIVNFINDELWGNLCDPDRPWCIKFPNADGYRYPSQIFEAILDILVLPILLLVYRRKPPDGVVAWTWFALYGITRSVAEIWRQTDFAVGPLTGGQLLALPMIVIGIVLAVLAYRRNVRTWPKPAPTA